MAKRFPDYLGVLCR